MKKIIEYPLGKEDVVYVEVVSTESSRKLTSKKTVEKAKVTFEHVIKTIKPTANAVIKQMKNLGDSPDEIGLEFGVKLSGELNCLVISSDLEANFKISLKWTKHK